MKFVAALWRFWHIRSHEAEALRWIRLALALDGRCDTEARARALYGAGWIAVDQREPAEAMTYFGQSLALFRSLGCRRGVAEALHGVATMAQADGRFADATVLLDESLSLYRELGDDEGIAWTLDHLGMGALSMHELARAQDLFDGGLAIFEGLRHAWGTAILRHHRGLVAMARNDHAEARRRLSDGSTAFQEVANSWGVATSLTHLGYVVLATGDDRAAAEYFTHALALTRADEDRGGMARSLAGLVSLAIEQDQIDHAALLFGAVEAAVDTGRVHTNPVARAIYKTSADAVAKAAHVDAVACALATGRAMPFGQVVELALRSGSTGPAVSFVPGSA